MQKVLGLALSLLLLLSGAAAGAVNVKSAPYNAVGDGSTDDTIAINAAIAAAVVAGDTVFFPTSTGCYKVSGTLLIDRSAITTRFQGMVHLVGEGQSRSCIFTTAGTVPLIEYRGSTAVLESDFVMENLRLTGNGASGTGIKVTRAAFVKLDNVRVEAFEYGFDGTDMDQSAFYHSQFTWNTKGVRFNASATIGGTSANSIQFFDVSIGNNTQWGLEITHANAFAMIGGTIQYNGDTTCGGTGVLTNCFGAHFIDAGDGYGTAWFGGGAIFEGNGGISDLWSTQSADKINLTLDTVSFARTRITGGPVIKGWATHQLFIDGSGANANYVIKNSNFYGYPATGYAADASRIAIVNNNPNAVVDVDAATKFWSTTETPDQTVLGMTPFTPTLTCFGGGSITGYVKQKGYYKKISARIIYIRVSIQGAAGSACTTWTFIDSLPFNASTNWQDDSQLLPGRLSNLGDHILLIPNGTQVYPYLPNNTSPAATDWLQFSGTYETVN